MTKYLPHCFRLTSLIGILLVSCQCVALAADDGGDAKPAEKYPPFDKLLPEKERKEYAGEDGNGLMKLYVKDDRLFAEISHGIMNQDLLLLISISQGIGQTPLVAGMSWGFEDDGLYQFRQVGERIQLIRRNVRFKAKANSPEAKAVELAYTDSVLFSLPIATKSPSGSPVVELTPIFKSDMPQISQVLRGYAFSASKSTFDTPKVYPTNVEISVAATYQSGSSYTFDTVPDARGVSIGIHYSVSKLPKTSYQPRLADDRVGYFLTAIKDFSKKDSDDRFVRYVNRWDLGKKLVPDAEMSPPEHPIIFYLEKTIPHKYRKPITDGILEWNRAFEKAGWIDAVRVIQQTEADNWAPEDVRYNTFRWITAGAGFAMGPSRVNPLTGQILDADIIFDADFIEYWKDEYETFTPESVAALTGGPLDIKSYRESLGGIPPYGQKGHMSRCEFNHGMSRELAFGDTCMLGHFDKGEAGKLSEEMIMQGLKEVTMHEVGHTLGLRHNFKSSTIYTLDELNSSEGKDSKALTGSVMDYAPANIRQKGQPQGNFFSTTIGPYDYWAIEYGYKSISGGTDGEVKDLEKIASRSGEPELTYATDEDTRGIDPDPLSNRFDLGKDPIKYAKARAELITGLYQGLVDDVVEEGDGYQKARRAFGVLLGNYGRAMYTGSRYIGGLYTTRSHKGDPDAQPPFVVVDADKQREALTLLEENVFNDKPYNFPPELYNHLAASRWMHWGVVPALRIDYPAHEVIALWQGRVLDQLFSPLTLERLHDSELKVPSDQDAFTTAELLERLTKAIFAEVDSIQPGEFTNRKPAISSLRRNLQRDYLGRLADLAMGNDLSPQDCQTVAFAQLKRLEERINALRARDDVHLDAYSDAHLEETAARIHKVLDAQLSLGTSAAGHRFPLIFFNQDKKPSN